MDPHLLGTLGPGRWDADNDLVWEILQPILRLATLIMQSIHPEYYDALFHGPRTPIDPARFPDNPPKWVTRAVLDGLRSFKSRALAPHDPNLQKSKDDLLKALKKYAKFKFRNKSDNLRYIGCTKYKVAKDAFGSNYPEIAINLDHENFEPLLRSDITASEKLGYQWQNALSIAHECAHAMHRISEYLKEKQDQALANWRITTEHHMRDHPIHELGYALEQFALGGVTKGETNPLGSLFPTIAFFWVEWPSRRWVNYSTNLVLKSPPLNPQYYYYPIPVNHFEDVHQIDFWNHVIKVFGPFMLALRSLKVTMQVTDLPNSPKARLLNMNTGEPPGSSWKIRHAALKSKQDMSADERRACNAGDKLIERAKLNEKFFANSKKQSQQLKAILDFNDDLKDKIHATTDAAFAAAISRGKQSTRVNPAYFALANSGEAPIEVEANLLRFNQGFRGFAREIAYIQWSEELNEHYQYIDEILEFKRQMLYSPEDENCQKVTVEYREFEEIDDIIYAYGKIGLEPEKMKSDISRIAEAFEKRWESSRYGRICAKIIKLAADIALGEAVDPEVELKEIDSKIQALTSLRSGEDNKPCDTWRVTLENMIKRMQTIVDDLRQKLAAPVALDTNMTNYDPQDEDDVATDNDMAEDDIATDVDSNEDNWIPYQPA
ncbi:hypothetical protein SBOR_7796 [Sclerotinia borealis F-4128]|uniref:Uncharacterized protein n=1 Tax=Sclerotinia borealis (strain F-4128) TaxID=1432307 RepID=W9C505_SCLBF|nr:hypothetical protein SBOR_7796 [Sclerotinia borealis F-4128]